GIGLDPRRHDAEPRIRILPDPSVARAERSGAHLPLAPEHRALPVGSHVEEVAGHARVDVRHPGHVLLEVGEAALLEDVGLRRGDRKSTRLNSSHQIISYAVFCLKKKTRAL